MKISSNIKGILWIIVSCFWLAIMGAIIKHLSADMNTYVMLFMRNVLALVLLTGWMVVRKGKQFRVPHTAHFKLHMARGFITTISMLLWIYGISVIPVTQALAIDYIHPVFAMILAVIFLGEKLSFSRIIMIVLGAIGAIVIIQPSAELINIGCGAALAANATYAVVTILLKLTTKNDGNKAVVFYASVGMSVFSLPFAIYYWQDISLENLIWLVIFAQVSNFYFFALSYAFKQADLIILLPFEFSSLLFISIISYFVFDEVVDIWTIVGAMVLLSGVLYCLRVEAKNKAL